MKPDFLKKILFYPFSGIDKDKAIRIAKELGFSDTDLANRFANRPVVVEEKLARAVQRYVLCNKTQVLAELLLF